MPTTSLSALNVPPQVTRQSWAEFDEDTDWEQPKRPARATVILPHRQPATIDDNHFTQLPLEATPVRASQDAQGPDHSSGEASQPSQEKAVALPVRKPAARKRKEIVASQP